MGVFEVFFSTIVVCTFSALAILSSGSWTKYGIEDSGVLAQRAFSDSLGTFGTVLITLAIVLFAFSTVLSFAFFIENQTTSLFGKRTGKFVQLIFFIFMGIGGVFGVAKLLQIADFGNAFIILINMTAVLMLGKTIGKETKEFFDKIDRGEL